MKVLILGYFPDDINSPYGGIEAVLVELYKQFRNLYPNDHFVFCTIKPEIPKYRVKYDGNMEVRYYNSPKIPQTINNFSFEFFKSMQIIREIKPDIINAHNISGYSLAAALSGYPHIITPHGDMLAELEINTRNPYIKPVKRLFWKILIKILFRRVKSFSWIGVYYKSKFENQVLSRHNFLIANPVPQEYFRIKRSESIEPMLLYATRIIKGKNIELAMEVVIELTKKFPNLQFILAGKTDQQFEEAFKLMEPKFAKYLDRNIFLTGHLNREELLHYYSKTWIYFHPSLQEISSTSIIQALAAGAPVVAGDIPGNKDLVKDGVNGYLCDINDRKNFVEHLDKLIANRQMRKKFGEASKEISFRFRPSVIAKEYMTRYSEIYSLSKI